MSNRCLNFTVTEKIFFKKVPGTQEFLHSGAPWTLPTLPTPLLRHCPWRVAFNDSPDLSPRLQCGLRHITLVTCSQGNLKALNLSQRFQKFFAARLS